MTVVFGRKLPVAGRASNYGSIRIAAIAENRLSRQELPKKYAHFEYQRDSGILSFTSTQPTLPRRCNFIPATVFSRHHNYGVYAEIPVFFHRFFPCDPLWTCLTGSRCPGSICPECR